MASMLVAVIDQFFQFDGCLLMRVAFFVQGMGYLGIDTNSEIAEKELWHSPHQASYLNSNSFISGDKGRESTSLFSLFAYCLAVVNVLVREGISVR